MDSASSVNCVQLRRNEEEMNFIETHDSYKKLRQKNIAYTIMRLYIQYSTIDNFIIIMVIGR